MNKNKKILDSVSYKLSAECITVKLSAYSIRDNIRKIPMDSGKFHVMLVFIGGNAFTVELIALLEYVDNF